VILLSFVTLVSYYEYFVTCNGITVVSICSTLLVIIFYVLSVSVLRVDGIGGPFTNLNSLFFLSLNNSIVRFRI
jgi:hypothetical protein